ncbi:MAG: helix-turn-helix domain-containing protein [Eubacteriales bacterium]
MENFIPLREAVEQVERKLITMAFQIYGNTYKVAEVLGISQPAAYRKVQRYLGGRI